MTFTFEDLLKLVGAVTAVMGVMEVMFLWAVKWMLNRLQAQLKRELDLRFDAWESQIAEVKERGLHTERALQKLQSDIPTHYVHREDWIKVNSVSDAKLDTIRDLLRGQLPCHHQQQQLRGESNVG